MTHGLAKMAEEAADAVDPHHRLGLKLHTAFERAIADAYASGFKDAKDAAAKKLEIVREHLSAQNWSIPAKCIEYAEQDVRALEPK